MCRFATNLPYMPHVTVLFYKTSDPNFKTITQQWFSPQYVKMLKLGTGMNSQEYCSFFEKKNVLVQAIVSVKIRHP